MKSLFDKYCKKYDAWYDKNKFAYLSEVKALRKVVPKKSEGLEIGVGTGRFASMLKIRNGVDPSAYMISLARKRGVAVRLGFGEKLPFSDEIFDYAAIIITLCFVNNPKKVIEEAARVLKKKGKIIVGIVDKESFLGKYYKLKKSVFYKKASFFSVREVMDLLRKCGFNKFICYQTLSKLPQELESIENPKKGFGKCGFVVVSARK